MDFITNFLLAFVPLFVAVDPLGLLPVFLSVTGEMGAARRRRVVLQAVPMAAGIGVGFFLVGAPLLKKIGIEIADLQIAGGAVLFVLALLDLVVPGKPTVQEAEAVGVVPLATPLIAGPAVLTLGLVLVERLGYGPVIAALLANLLVLLGLLLGVERVVHVLPMNTMRAISKVVMLLLAAIGVSLIRVGVMAAVRGQ